MISTWDLANPQLRSLAVYEPGKPIEETARELGVEPSEIIKLASNENPLGPSPKAVEAMRFALEQAHLYPDGSGFYLIKAIAQKLGLMPENVILGNGSNEVIEFLGHAFLNPGDDVITCQYAFIVYKLLATAFGVRTIETPSPDYQQNLDRTLDAITPKTRIIFVPNPNNPTGTLILQSAIDSFMSRVPENIIVVFDEAYFEFLDSPPDTLRFIRDGRNVVVLRTFSKIHGLAGLRVGYGMAVPEIIEVLHKTRQPFNVNSIAQAYRDANSVRASRCKFHHGECLLRFRSVPEAVAAESDCAPAERLWLAGMDSDFGRHNEGEPSVNRGSAKLHSSELAGTECQRERRHRVCFRTSWQPKRLPYSLNSDR
jgi:histidinol-phosphate aminotransferase